MATENTIKEMVVPKSKLKALLPVLLRSAAVAAMITAALLMGLNKQSKTATVAIIGTTPILQTFTAKFQHTPAFVYFVIANAIASVYNLLVLSLGSFVKCKAYGVSVHLADTVMIALVATGAAAAASMAELGKNGNQHAMWRPICDKFNDFCCRGGAALIASFVGALLLIVLNGVSTLTLYKNTTIKGAKDCSIALIKA